MWTPRDSPILLSTESPLRRRPEPVLNSEIQDPIMAPDDQNRRHTDRGYVPQFPSTFTALRWALGLVPANESLRSLSHWRRRPAAADEALAED